MNDSNTRDRVIAVFAEQFGRAPTGIARAPGRVNLIGEHTDYNDGFVLPVAIDRGVWIAFTARDDDRVRLIAANFDHQPDDFSLREVVSSRAKNKTARWSNYARGVAWALQQRGIQLRGFDGVIFGDVPAGAGLSSSAAIELAVAMTFQGVSGFSLPQKEFALACQQAENVFVGNRCGIMDQFISALGRAGHALLIDCRDLSHKLVPLPSGVKIVVCNSMLKRGLVDSEYNERRAQCEEGVKIFQKTRPEVKALRDVSEQDLHLLSADFPDLLAHRCRHVVTENRRVLDTVIALEASDLQTVGRLMVESHESLRYDFEVSCRQLDILVTLAQNAPGYIGARLTGAGFGGCTVNLVEAKSVTAFQDSLQRAAQSALGYKPEIYVCEAADGASVADIP
jgi:galactokinase